MNVGRRHAHKQGDVWPSPGHPFDIGVTPGQQRPRPTKNVRGRCSSAVADQSPLASGGLTVSRSSIEDHTRSATVFVDMRSRSLCPAPTSVDRPASGRLAMWLEARVFTRAGLCPPRRTGFPAGVSKAKEAGWWVMACLPGHRVVVFLQETKTTDFYFSAMAKWGATVATGPVVTDELAGLADRCELAPRAESFGQEPDREDQFEEAAGGDGEQPASLRHVGHVEQVEEAADEERGIADELGNSGAVKRAAGATRQEPHLDAECWRTHKGPVGADPEADPHDGAQAAALALRRPSVRRASRAALTSSRRSSRVRTEPCSRIFSSRAVAASAAMWATSSLRGRRPKRYCESAIDRCPANAQSPRDGRHMGLPSLVPGLRDRELFRRPDSWSATHPSASSRRREPSTCPLPDEVPLELRERSEDVEDQLPAWRRGVDALGGAPQFDASLRPRRDSLDSA